ncbi:hypothetical protein [Streptomyces mangrovisoli]|uniref:Uncharacterized protein n=1 Tax=Streptomyces mangrovisoli TaxID=1428628 RepID=A0A1J4P3L9_9ACTN|nr:hypothetical protein [Streptomyces mangrovisoli]OIJ68077.1 hypothetical protein WN71_009785 [Streptomyces mangrovisoli]
MPSQQLVVIYPPADDGGRRVRLGEHFVGLAYTLLDVAEFLRRAGMEDVEPEDVATAAWVEWRGGGAGGWVH